MGLSLRVLPDALAICRFGPDVPVPGWTAGGRFHSVTRTETELSVVCAESNVPAGARAEGGWRALEVEGPLSFELTGILSEIAGVLAAAEVSIFAISTFDTDYVLVKDASLARARRALTEAGHAVT